MKLFNVLNQLHKREITKLNHFVSTPLFNKRDDLKHLLKTWIKEKGRRHPPKVYWQKMYPNKEFSLVQWNLLTSRLFKLVEDFLAINEMKENEAQKKFYLAKAYRRTKQEKLFKDAVKDVGKALDKQTYRNVDYLQGQHDLSFEQYDYVISINRKEKTNLQEVSDHLDAYIIAAKLRQACNALSRQIINQEQYSIGLLPEILSYIQENPGFLEIPAISIYYYGYQAINARDNENYFRLFRESISKHQQYFPPYEMRDMYTFVINFYIRKLNKGSSIYAKEAFELYKLSLEQGYILDDGIMLESTYVNIVVLASILGSYEWAKSFIEKYQQHLKPEYRVPLYHFSLGKLYYEQGDFDKSLKQLIMVETKAAFIFLGARILQLKIYYELGEINPLENLLESLRVYLQRSKGLAYRKAHYSNILVFTRQLLQLPAMSKHEREAFRNRVQNAEIFGEKQWFLSQIK